MPVDTKMLLSAPIAAFHARSPQRTWSLIVSFLGDCVLPRDGVVRAGTITDFCGLAAIEPGLVRTALSRLVARSFLWRERIGRNSFYRLTDQERAAFSQAADLIYGRKTPVATGGFELVTIDGVPDRADVRQQLLAQRFAALGPVSFVRAHHADEPLSVPEGSIVFAAAPEGDVHALAANLWPIEELASGYRSFLHLFGGFDQPMPLSAEQSVLARVLLVHEFRRLLLKDPFLPIAALPEGWTGREARTLFDQAHAALSLAANQWLEAQDIES